MDDVCARHLEPMSRETLNVCCETQENVTCEGVLFSEVVDLSGGGSEHWCDVSLCDCVLGSVPIVTDLSRLRMWCAMWILRRFRFLIVKLLNTRYFLCLESVTLGVRGEDEYRKASRQSCPRRGQEEAHAAKCDFQSSAEWVRSRAPVPPEGTPLLQIAIWLGPPKDPPVDVDDMEVEEATPPLLRLDTYRPAGTCCILFAPARSCRVKWP